MRRAGLIISLLLAAACAAPGPAMTREAQEPQEAREVGRVVMATNVEEQSAFAAKWLALVYRAAFRQLGIELTIRPLPPARASVEAAAGNIDGELARGYQYASVQPALLRVPEPAFFGEIAAYARDPAIDLKADWEGLRGSRYRIEYRSGYAVFQQRLAAVLPGGAVSGVASTAIGLRKLAIGRSDLYLDVADVVDPMLATPEFRATGIHLVAVLEHLGIHAYLTKKHEKLVPRLAAVLKKMRESGQIERMRLLAQKE